MHSTLMTLAFAAAFFGTSGAQASPVTFSAVLNGANEFPANASPGTGIATVDFDLAAHTMRVRIDFSGLSSPTLVAHIHCCTAVANAGNVGVATVTPTFPGFPSGVVTGSYDYLFDTSVAGTYNMAFITANGGSAAGAEAALFAGMGDAESYVNIHSAAFPAGEIRGFLEVPEPGSLTLMGLGLAGLAFSVRKKQKKVVC